MVKKNKFFGHSILAVFIPEKIESWEKMPYTAYTSEFKELNLTTSEFRDVIKIPNLITISNSEKLKNIDLVLNFDKKDIVKYLKLRLS